MLFLYYLELRTIGDILVFVWQEKFCCLKKLAENFIYPLGDKWGI